VAVSTTATVSWAALAIAGFGLTGGFALFVVSRRRRPEAKMARLEDELHLRLRGLDEELGLTREESRRALTLGTLAWTLRIEDVLVRIADAARDQLGVDAALVIAPTASGRYVRGSSGLSPEERAQLAEDLPLGRRFEERRSEYAPAAGDGSTEPRPVVRGIDVPVEHEGETIGMLMIFSRDESFLFDDDTVRQLKELAAWAGPAIANARSFDTAERLADFDTRTGLYNKRYFLATLEREVGRAHRARTKGVEAELALILFDLDDFGQINKEHGLQAGDAVLLAIGERVRQALRRPTDIAAQYGGDEFTILLPEATIEDAQRTYRYLQAEIEGPIHPIDRISFSCGIAALKPSESANAFFDRADQALRRAKLLGKGRMELAE